MVFVNFYRWRVCYEVSLVFRHNRTLVGSYSTHSHTNQTTSGISWTLILNLKRKLKDNFQLKEVVKLCILHKLYKCVSNYVGLPITGWSFQGCEIILHKGRWPQTFSWTHSHIVTSLFYLELKQWKDESQLTVSVNMTLNIRHFLAPDTCKPTSFTSLLLCL